MPCYGTIGAHIQLHRLLLITHLHVWLYKLHMSTLQASTLTVHLPHRLFSCSYLWLWQEAVS